jgi:hypothetical protein
LSRILHPYFFFGVPGNLNATAGSQKVYYVPTTVFAGDGLVIMKSYASAFFLSRSAAHFAGGGVLNPVQGFPTEAAAQAYLHTNAPQITPRPPLVPYLRAQLSYLELLDDSDPSSDLSPLHPMTIAGRIIGSKTPDLHHYYSHSDKFGSCPCPPPPGRLRTLLRGRP